MRHLRVLKVKDETIISWALQIKVEQLNAEVVAIVSTADKAVDTVRDEAPDLILMDIKLKGLRTGIDAAIDIRAFSTVSIVYLSCNVHLVSDEQKRATNPIGVYSKPPYDEELRSACDAALALMPDD
jgi:CheY-like chemotaxis protein